MISAKGLYKNFQDNHVINGVDFELKKGERVVILGPSGSGKSTFLRLINRLEEPSSGEVYFKGELITSHNIERIRTKIGMVFQHFNLINNMTVIKNLTFAPTTLNLMTTTQAERKALKLLAHIGLLEKKNAYPASLSVGQKQRIAIIRAMMMDPEVLLFDEPTSALDPESIGEVLSLIRELVKSGMTIMIVTHEISFAKEMASRVIFLDQGKIIESTTPKKFFEQPKTPRVKEFLSKVL